MVHAINNIGDRGKVVIIAMCALFASVFFCVPTPFAKIAYLRNPDKFQALLEKKDNLLSSLEKFGPETHAAKGVFRLTVPLLMKVLNIETPLALYRLQLLFGILIYFLASAIVCSIIKDFFPALFITLAMSGTFFARWFYLDAYPCLDTFAFFFALLGIWSRAKPILLFLSAIALFYTDERGALSAGIVFISIKMFELERCEDITLAHLFSFKGVSRFLLLGLAVSVAIRLYLNFVQNMHTPTGGVGDGVFTRQWMYIQQGVFAGAAGFWGIFIVTIGHAVIKRKWLFACVVTAFILLFLAVSVNVFDITRSTSYLIPLSFVCVKYLYDNIPNISYSFATVAVINVIYPTTFVIEDNVYTSVGYPAFILLLQKVAGLI